MANLCDNSIVVSCTNSKKGKSELQRFVEEANDMKCIEKKDLNKARKLYLEQNREKYIKNRDMIDFIKHSTMRPLQFFVYVLGYRRNDDGSVSTGEALSIDKTIPMPDELKKYCAPARQDKGESRKKFTERIKRFQKVYGVTDFDAWRRMYWGTSGAYDSELNNLTKTSATYRITSNWSPPLGWLENVSKKYPNLHFEMTYEEPGEGFKGEASAYNGELENSSWNFVPECGECNQQYDGDGNCGCNHDE